MVGLGCYDQSGVTEQLVMRDTHYARMCFKPSELYILSCGKDHGLGLFTTKNVKLLGLYPIYVIIPALRPTVLVSHVFRRQFSIDFDEILQGLCLRHAATTVTFSTKYYIVQKLDHLTCSKYKFCNDDVPP